MDLSELLDRIERRREALGLSERAVSIGACGKPDCIRGIRRGHPPRKSVLRGLAKVLDCPLSYLEEVTPEIRMDEDDSRSEDGEPPEGYAFVPTLNVRAGMGGPGFLEDDPFGDPILLPERLIRVELKGSPTDFLGMEVLGNSMSPILESGDQVLIDKRQINPAQPGVFALNEGMGLVAKKVEYIPHSDPPKLRIRSENAEESKPYERLVEEARIFGRVVWFARRL